MPAIAEELTFLSNALLKLIHCKFAFQCFMSSVGDDLKRNCSSMIMISVSMETIYKADCLPVLFSQYEQLSFHSSMCISIYSEFLLQDNVSHAIEFCYAALLICWELLASAYLPYCHTNQETRSFHISCRDFLDNQSRRELSSAHQDLSKDKDAPPPNYPHPIHVVSAIVYSRTPANIIASSRPQSVVESNC